MKPTATVILFSVFLSTLGCADGSAEHGRTQGNNTNAGGLKVGGLYASKGKDGKYSFMKILAIDDFAVHARPYNEKFDVPPATIRSADLTFFVGHIPIAREGFLMDGDTLVAVEEVTEQELDGYRVYLEATKGK